MAALPHLINYIVAMTRITPNYPIIRPIGKRNCVKDLGCCVGKVVSLYSFYSNRISLNLADVNNNTL